MPLKILSDEKKEFYLEKADEKYGSGDEPTKVLVRQATQGDFELVNDLMANLNREYDGRVIRVSQRISFDDIRKKQVFLTLCGCNIVDDQGDSPKPLFTFNNQRLTDEPAFLQAWYKLPPDVAEEIHEAVLEMNPLWRPEGERSSQTE